MSDTINKIFSEIQRKMSDTVTECTTLSTTPYSTVFELFFNKLYIPNVDLYTQLRTVLEGRPYWWLE